MTILEAAFSLGGLPPYASQGLWEMYSIHGRNSWQAYSRGERYHRKMKTDGMDTQCLPFTGVKGKKKSWYNPVHPRCMNQGKLKERNKSTFTRNNKAHSVNTVLKTDIFHQNSRLSAPPPSTHTHHTPTRL